MWNEKSSGLMLDPTHDALLTVMLPTPIGRLVLLYLIMLFGKLTRCPTRQLFPFSAALRPS